MTGQPVHPVDGCLGLVVLSQPTHFFSALAGVFMLSQTDPPAWRQLELILFIIGWGLLCFVHWVVLLDVSRG